MRTIGSSSKCVHKQYTTIVTCCDIYHIEGENKDKHLSCMYSLGFSIVWPRDIDSVQWDSIGLNFQYIWTGKFEHIIIFIMYLYEPRKKYIIVVVIGCGWWWPLRTLHDFPKIFGMQFELVNYYKSLTFTKKTFNNSNARSYTFSVPRGLKNIQWDIDFS